MVMRMTRERDTSINCRPASVFQERMFLHVVEKRRMGKRTRKSSKGDGMGIRNGIKKGRKRRDIQESQLKVTMNLGL